MSFTTSANGLQFIKDFEGLVLTAQSDGFGTCTIGYGHTNYDVPKIHVGEKITEEQADEWLPADLKKFEDAVNDLGVKLNQTQFDALVSFDFNTGDLLTSTIPARLRKGDTAGAMTILLEYDHDNGKVVDGLVRRRKAERLMFMGEVAAALKIAAS